jgi:hypothetical protein
MVESVSNINFHYDPTFARVLIRAISKKLLTMVFLTPDTLYNIQ